MESARSRYSRACSVDVHRFTGLVAIMTESIGKRVNSSLMNKVDVSPQRVLRLLLAVVLTAVIWPASLPAQASQPSDESAPSQTPASQTAPEQEPSKPVPP